MSTCPAVAPTLQQVFEAGERHLLHHIAPHPYKLADRVYRAMNLSARDALRHENQTILLTGNYYVDNNYQASAFALVRVSLHFYFVLCFQGSLVLARRGTCTTCWSTSRTHPPRWRSRWACSSPTTTRSRT